MPVKPPSGSDRLSLVEISDDMNRELARLAGLHRVDPAPAVAAPTGFYHADARKLVRSWNRALEALGCAADVPTVTSVTRARLAQMVRDVNLSIEACEP